MKAGVGFAVANPVADADGRARLNLNPAIWEAIAGTG